MQRKVPKVPEDGTFCITVRFETQGELVARIEDIQKWIEEWIGTNGETRRLCTPATFRECFSQSPKVLGLSRNSILIEFQVNAFHREWKDWIVFMTRDLRRLYPGIRLKVVRDASKP